MRTVHLCLVLTLTTRVASGAEGPDSVAVAEAAAKANAATPAGKSYVEELGRAFGREHSRTVGACARATRRPNLTNFELFIQAERDGRVLSVLATPETNLSTCVRDRLKAWKVPAPPGAAYWARIDVLLQTR